MSICLKHSTVVGCWNKVDNTKENVVIHYTYATNASGVEILKAIRYTISDGTPITLSVGDTVTPGECVVCSNKIFATHDRYYWDGTNCLTVQEIKEKDSCTGIETYRFVIEDGAGLLVPASTVIVGFDETALSAVSCQDILNPITRERNHYVVTGTTPVSIAQGFLSLTVTKTSSTGQVLISGTNATDYPLDVLGEVYSIDVKEPYSEQDSIIITGTTAITTFKIIELR